MPEFENKFHNFELQPNVSLHVVAVLEDAGGNKYFLKTAQGQYIFLDENLDKYEEVPEVAVASAILKHGYQPVENSQNFEFGQRKEFLKGR